MILPDTKTEKLNNGKKTLFLGGTTWSKIQMRLPAKWNYFTHFTGMFSRNNTKAGQMMNPHPK